MSEYFSTPKNRKLVLIDGYAILHRAYHALPPLTTKKGEPINAVYGLVSMLLRVVQDLKPTHLAVAFDRPEPTFRQKEFPDYQAQRPSLEKDLQVQIAKTRDVLSAMDIPIFETAGYEADDIIGTLAQQATKVSEELNQPKIDEVVVVTGDRDILQLVDDVKNIRVYMPVKGLSTAKLLKEADVVEKLGVKPSQIPDFKALVGDPSDNYPGVAGIGPKTAAKLLTKYGNLEEIYNHLTELDETTRKKLEAGRKSAFKFQKLARIVKDVKLNFDLENLKRWRVDNQKVLDLFSEYGFKTLTTRVKEVGKSIVSENQASLF